MIKLIFLGTMLFASILFSQLVPYYIPRISFEGLNAQLIPSCVTAFIGIVNLIYLFYNTTRNRRQELADKEKDKLSFWYREIILKNNLPLINEFFNELKDYLEIEQISQEELEKSFHKKVTYKIESFQTTVVDILSVVNDDLSKSVRKMIEELEDFIHLKYFDEEYKKTDITNHLFQVRNKMLIKLHEFDKSGYESA
ncbi:hypothetical protein [Bacillus halotolerans]|uniref:hypothetical protein n=1 Tax=Bacillus halotolerans TaxID=260554 RepID=UPI00241049CD|nr:hypothetical protein [Bacillus halotolerans]MDG3075168.1 hypothetical protein [Bacillus halotolerans]